LLQHRSIEEKRKRSGLTIDNVWPRSVYRSLSRTAPPSVEWASGPDIAFEDLRMPNGRWPHVSEAFHAEASPYALQAAIAAEHCKAARAAETNWPKIVELYDSLERAQPSPVVSLSRAVALAMALWAARRTRGD